MKKLEIQNISISGFKSIQYLPDFEPRSINVFIGQNGAGKSNFIGFFEFLSNMLSGTGNLAEYTGRLGGASAFLFDGAERTVQIGAYIRLRTISGVNEYRFRLSHASSDTFIFTEEQFRYSPHGIQDRLWYDLGAGHKGIAIDKCRGYRKNSGNSPRTVAETNHCYSTNHPVF